MDILPTIYWVTFGVGLVFVLLSFILGSIGHGFSGGHAALDGAAHLDAHLELGHGGAGPGLDAADIADASHLDAGLEASGGHAGGAPGGHDSLEARAADSGMTQYSPFSLLSLMGTLCGFGAGGLLALAGGLAGLVTLLPALAGGALVSTLLWLIIGKFLYRMQGSSHAHESDMLGLEAEVLVPVQDDLAGEIAYVLSGTRYTAPARLNHAGRVAQNETVRIRRVEGHMVYVEEKRKLLS